MNIFDMGDYNFYVSTSVLISFLLLYLTYYDAQKKHKDAIKSINIRNERE